MKTVSNNPGLSNGNIRQNSMYLGTYKMGIESRSGKAIYSKVDPGAQHSDQVYKYLFTHTDIISSPGPS
ncbi:hypothetical protein XELAEV_18022785mg [Xenopus laevis]|uniref:Uncharacterized protein n=1 Tax=Xenopus laevis TaxID=8355 RepID=A0A974HNH7_XENLA|nr:hypothetical protein XELAEV_18022785mg [Xenopus laevis]